jgi:hypothetical protein
MSERISWSGEDGIAGARKIPLLDRALGAALAFFGAAITLILAPAILATALPGLAVFSHPYFAWKFWEFFIWGALWIFPVAIGGWIAGFPRVLNLFSHLWFTAEPPDRQLSLLLWSVIVLICALTGFAIWPN